MVLEPKGERIEDNDPRHKMAKMVKLLMKVGPDIDLISRMTGTYKETLRYWYKEKIIGAGMVIQAVPNEVALGMRRIAVRVRVPELFLPHIQPMFWAMNDLSYATAFELAIPDDYFVLHASVPVEFTEAYRSFIRGLTEMGIFESADLYEFDWFRRIPMRADYYDFTERRWDYNWQDAVPIEQDEMRPVRSERGKLDMVDLLMLKEMQLDANRSLKEVNEAISTKHKLEVNYKTLAWHYQNHVTKPALISGYSVRWPGTKYNQEADKAEHRQHKYIVVNLVVRGVTPNETLELTGKMHQTPFLWSEMAGRDYLAQFAFPIESVMEALEYLRQAVHPFGQRATHYIVDQKNSVQFVLPYNLWSEANKSWTFDRDSTLSRFDNLGMKIKSGAGPA
jgi:hypothetical protein